jgi:hypothetical protein
MEKSKKYTVKSVYGIACAKSSHRVLERALKHRDSMAGQGWIVVDEDGAYYEWDGAHESGVCVGI